MSKEHYWYIFGKLQPHRINNDRLLIERGNINWVSTAISSGLYKKEVLGIFQLSSKIIIAPKEDLSLTKIDIFEKLKTDETLIDATILVKTSDSTKQSFLKLETCSKHNCYNWQNLEISLGKSQTEYTELKIQFNLPDIRHREDKLRLYFHNPENVTIEIKEFNIIATSAIRLP